jgi:hypothetical protein
MTPVTRKIRLDQPLVYQVKLQGRLPERWISLIDGETISYGMLPDGTTFTILTFIAIDQSALHGILNQIRDFDLPLLSLDILE